MDQFEKDQKSINKKTILSLIAIFLLGLFTCSKIKCQSAEVKSILNSITSSSWTYPNGGNMFTEDGIRVRIIPIDTTINLWVGLTSSDTTEVIYVLLKEDYLEQINNTVDSIPYPYLETIYGYYVQNWKPYSVVFYDSLWNVIEEPLFIKKRKLFKNK